MPDATERITIQGHTALSRNGSDLFLHNQTTVIAPGHVETQLTGLGPGCVIVKPVVSTHPAVRDYELQIDRAREISAYINRPIETRFKPNRVRSAKKKAAAKPTAVHTEEPFDG